MNDEFRTVTDISSSLNEFKKLISSNIFNQPDNPFFKSALIHLLILSRDLTQKSYIKGKTIDFTDDMVVTDKIKNVTFLSNMQEMLFFAILILKTMFYVKKIILCFLFNVIFGKGTLAQIGDLTMTSDYDDDICIFFCDQKYTLFVTL